MVFKLKLRNIKEYDDSRMWRFHVDFDFKDDRDRFVESLRRRLLSGNGLKSLFMGLNFDGDGDRYIVKGLIDFDSPESYVYVKKYLETPHLYPVEEDNWEDHQACIMNVSKSTLESSWT